MRTGHYRLTVIACVLSWFLVGLHLPALHEMTHPGQAPRWSVVVATAALLALGLAGLWTLLRAPARGGPGASA